MVQVKKRSEKGNVIIRADQIGDRCYTGKSWNKTEEKIDGVTIHYMAKFDKESSFFPFLLLLLEIDAVQVYF